MDIANSIALVTGANRGIGRSLVLALVDAGAAKVYAAARRTETVQDLADQHPGVIVPLRIDVTDQASLDTAAKTAADATLLINNAGVLAFNDVLSADWNGFENDMTVNYFGAARFARAFAPNLIANKAGSLTNLNSVVSLAPMPGIAGYSASKAAEYSLTRSLRIELAPHNIAVHSVHPGPVDTDMAADLEMDKASPDHVAAQILAGIARGDEDIFPDPFAENVKSTWTSDPTAVASNFAGAAH